MKANASTTPGPSATSPPPASWELFGRRVRQLREEAGVAPRDVVLGEVLSAGELARIEAGTAPLYRTSVDWLDQRLGARGRLRDAWARTRISQHLAAGEAVAELERDAERVGEYNPGQIPEPLRTLEYATALAQAAHPLEPWRGRMAADAQRRRGRRVGGCSSPALGVIVDEAALRAQVGEVATTLAQLRHLRGFLATGWVGLHVVPTATPTHPNRATAFRLITLSPHHTVGYVPAPCGPGQLVTDPEHVAALVGLYDALKGEALPQAASAALLRSITTELERQIPKELTAVPHTSETGLLPTPDPVPATH